MSAVGLAPASILQWRRRHLVLASYSPTRSDLIAERLEAPVKPGYGIPEEANVQTACHCALSIVIAVDRGMDGRPRTSRS
jgi:hypothetical protein